MLSKRFFGSIRTRMVAIYLVVTILALLAISFTVAIIVETFLVNQRTETQLEETTRLALEIAPELDGNDAETIYGLIVERARSMGGRVLIMNTDAVVEYDSASYQMGARLPYREVRDVLIGGKEASFGYHKINRESSGAKAWGLNSVWAVYYTAPITLDGVYTGAVLFSSLLQDVEDSVAQIIGQIALAFTVVVAVMTIATFMLSKVVTKPITELTGAIASMGRKGKSVRVEVTGKGEMAELGTAFNRMSEQIADHDRIRDEFVSNVSHELKTPLATMKLLSESIIYEENPDPKMMKEFFGDVNHEVDRLTGVINDLLRLVRFDEAEGELKPVAIRLDSIVVRVGDRLKPIADKKGIKLIVETTPCTVSGEDVRLDQVVMNLIENGIKYTDEGEVRVRLASEDNEAVLYVEDTGIGIPEDAIAHLFERFYRVDKARSRSTGGTGLGLSIVDKIVKMHGGYVEVKSKPGSGSTFIMHIPLFEKEEA